MGYIPEKVKKNFRVKNVRVNIANALSSQGTQESNTVQYGKICLRVLFVVLCHRGFVRTVHGRYIH